MGRDRAVWEKSLREASFNPRARVGRDGGDYHLHGRTPGFNPRARVGRDSDRRDWAVGGASFNPRARVGRDWAVEESWTSVSRFQSTRPRGARLYVFNHQKFCSITKPFSTNLPKRSLRKRHSFSSKIICNIISNCCCLREPSGFLGGLEVLASENQCSLGIIRRFCAYMFDVPPPLIPKDIKAQAALRFIHFFHKGCS